MDPIRVAMLGPDHQPVAYVEVAVSDDFVETTIGALCEGARTGEVGDGKIFVVPLEQAVRIRTGDTDTDAVTPLDK